MMNIQKNIKKFPQKKLRDKFRELSNFKKFILGIYILGTFINMIFCLYGINKNIHDI